MIETELRDAFTRAEAIVPDGRRLIPAIATAARRRRRARRLSQVGSAVLATVLAIALPVFGRAWLDRPIPAQPLPSYPAAADLSGPLNILLAGVEQRPVPQGGVIARADTIVIAHVPRDRSAIYLMVVPRDLAVEIPGHGRTKINASLGLGGLGLLSETVTGITGTPFDAAVAVPFLSLEQVVDSVGGVVFCVDAPTVSVHTGKAYEAGCGHFSGAEALDYVRQRLYPDGSSGRDRHVLQLLAALVDRMNQRQVWTDTAQLTRLSDAIGPDQTVDTGGHDVVDLAWTVRDATRRVVGLTVPVVNNADGNLDLAAEATSLFEALRADRLHEWAARNPAAVVTGQR